MSSPAWTARSLESISPGSCRYCIVPSAIDCDERPAIASAQILGSMHGGVMAIELEVLGSAAVSEAELSKMVARYYNWDDALLIDVSASRFPYEIPSLTTAGRFKVSGTARFRGREAKFSFFVKHVQEWSLSSEFKNVPPEMREWARTTIPWLTEAEVYTSTLANQLPSGFSMPSVLSVRTIDESSYSVWLDLVDKDSMEWSIERYIEAAQLLGRFAGGIICEVGSSTSDPRL